MTASFGAWTAFLLLGFQTLAGQATPWLTDEQAREVAEAAIHSVYPQPCYSTYRSELGLQSATSSTSASGALSKNLVAEERVELSCPKALVPKTSVSPDFTTRPDCCWSLTTIRAQPG